MQATFSPSTSVYVEEVLEHLHIMPKDPLIIYVTPYWLNIHYDWQKAVMAERSVSVNHKLNEKKWVTKGLYICLWWVRICIIVDQLQRKIWDTLRWASPSPVKTSCRSQRHERERRKGPTQTSKWRPIISNFMPNTSNTEDHFFLTRLMWPSNADHSGRRTRGL